jgi:hypothetical protein
MFLSKELILWVVRLCLEVRTMSKDSYDDWYGRYDWYYNPTPTCPMCRLRERQEIYAEHLWQALWLTDSIPIGQPKFAKELLNLTIQVNDGNLKGGALARELFNLGTKVACED